MLDKAAATGTRVRVIALEPVPKIFAELKRRVHAEALDDSVELLNQCAGREFGTARMYIAEGLAGSHSMVRDQGTGVEVDVEVTTIEDICNSREIERVDLLKIDAEGADFDVILGALPLLRENRIRVLQFEYNHCWIDARRYLRDVFELADRHGLAVGKLVGDGIEIYPVWHPELERFIEGNYVIGHLETLQQLGGKSGSFDASNTYALD